MSGHVVRLPDDCDGLRDVGPGCNEEESEVFDAHGKEVLAEEHNVSDRRNEDTDDSESVAVPQAIGEISCQERCSGADGVNGDCAQLGLGGGVAEFVEDRGDEEGCGVAGCCDAQVDECTE